MRNLSEKGVRALAFSGTVAGSVTAIFAFTHDLGRWNKWFFALWSLSLFAGMIIQWTWWQNKGFRFQVSLNQKIGLAVFPLYLWFINALIKGALVTSFLTAQKKIMSVKAIVLLIYAWAVGLTIAQLTPRPFEGKKPAPTPSPTVDDKRPDAKVIYLFPQKPRD